MFCRLFLKLLLVLKKGHHQVSKLQQIASEQPGIRFLRTLLKVKAEITNARTTT